MEDDLNFLENGRRPHFFFIYVRELANPKQSLDAKRKQAGAELCRAQEKLGLPSIELEIRVVFHLS